MKTLKKDTEITGINEFEKFTEAEKLLIRLNEILLCDVNVKNKLRKKLEILEEEIFELRKDYQIKKLMELKKVG